MAFLCMSRAVSCVQRWLLGCLLGEADLTQELRDWTEVPQTWCVADMRIAVRPSCFGSRPVSLTSYV